MSSIIVIVIKSLFQWKKKTSLMQNQMQRVKCNISKYVKLKNSIFYTNFSEILFRENVRKQWNWATNVLNARTCYFLGKTTLCICNLETVRYTQYTRQMSASTPPFQKCILWGTLALRGHNGHILREARGAAYRITRVSRANRDRIRLSAIILLISSLHGVTISQFARKKAIKHLPWYSESDEYCAREMR